MQRSAFALVLAVVFAGAGLLAPRECRADVAAAPSLQALLDRRAAAAPGTGVVLGLIDRGTVTILKAGSSGTDRALDEHTLFEIGSVTKTFTATALALMARSGQVALTDPVARYLPSGVRVPQRDGHTITLENLATQHSGLPRMPDNFRPADPANPYADYRSAQLYAFLNGNTLERDPGAAFAYSNLGVGLLGTALANRAGTSYESLIRTRVWRPLGMNETSITLSPAARSEFAVGHSADGAPVHAWDFAALAGAGAIRSNVADMLKYVRCEMGQGPLAEACLATQQPRATIPAGKIGLIWWIDANSGAIEHGGDTAGYHAMVATSADHRTGVVVLTNGGDNPASIAYAALGIAVPAEPAYETAAVAAPVLDSYAGSYGVPGDPNRITIARDGDHLSAQLTGQSAAPIYPLGNDHFYYKVVAASYRFVRDASGNVVGLALYQNGVQYAARLNADGTPVGPVPVSAYPAIVTLDANALAAYAGTYDRGAGQSFTVRRDGDGITVQLTGQSAYPVFPMGHDRFFYKIVDAELQFTRDDAGRVNGVELHQNGRAFPAAAKTGALSSRMERSAAR